MPEPPRVPGEAGENAVGNILLFNAPTFPWHRFVASLLPFSTPLFSHFSSRITYFSILFFLLLTVGNLANKPTSASSAPTMPPKKNAEAGPSKPAKATTSKATGRGRAKKTDAEPATKTTKAAVKKVTKVTKKETTEASTSAAKPKKQPAAKSTASKGKAAATTKAKTTTATKPTPASKKRKADDDDEEEAKEDKPREPKKPRVVREPKPKVVKTKPAPPKVVINDVPKTRLNVFVCGEGSSGELGLGAAKNAIDVKRPRLNKLLDAQEVGVVQIAVGGMHCLALTHDNKILTWGVNDQGALGRDTAWDGGYKEIKEDAESGSDSDDSDDDSGLNPKESTPTPILSSAFPEGTVFVAVAAADSASFALTDDGLVYGWGTFRVSFLASCDAHYPI